ncbi:conserved protein, unknown function [Plasmodium vinckei vinckei]|uniref:Uncharacterized protein n=1 Tax=Plasmodium vinckei vinckei TaxID=54757 RepID=A0A449BWK7_PLAVN|nr:conserved protein, unknown function [Plasmodium vinckei vinckei]KEG03470.1 hypothetical protein YYE_01494 [Plasmodium vinckei vinckei]VEV57761.1 conserved protein, unknown function [Plasmodium vinckei vinckei]
MPVCFCVYKVTGFNNMINIILYREPILIDRNNESKYIIFFPGDYSNFFTNTIYTYYTYESTNECSDYCFSYEALFWVISSKYLYDHIIFIKPSVFVNHFSTFSNFINDDSISLSPTLQNEVNQKSDKYIDGKGIKHLLYILLSLNDNIIKERNRGDSSIDGNGSKQNDDTLVSTNFQKSGNAKDIDSTVDNHNKYINNAINIDMVIRKKLILIGFSKGCSVLFSLLREINKAEFILPYIESVYFLDPGFNKNIYNTHIEPNSLEILSKYNLKIFIHSTPNQIFERNSMTVHKELTNFITILRNSNIPIFSYFHYINIGKSIDPINLHFEVLEDFSNRSLEKINNITPFINSCNQIGIICLENKKPIDKFLFKNWRI